MEEDSGLTKVQERLLKKLAKQLKLGKSVEVISDLFSGIREAQIGQIRVQRGLSNFEKEIVASILEELSENCVIQIRKRAEDGARCKIDEEISGGEVGVEVEGKNVDKIELHRALREDNIKSLEIEICL